MEVVRLGAWCDTRTADEHREELVTSGWSMEQVESSLQTFREALHFRVHEFALLSDGRRLILNDDRGWSSKESTGQADDQWAHLTVQSVESAVRTVVLPDDAEQTGDDHPWSWLAARLASLGVETTTEDLKLLPYAVVLSQRLRARLTSAR